MIALISGRPSSRVPVRAVTVTRLVIAEPELVMNCLAPLTTHSSPTQLGLGAGGAGVGAGARLGEAEAGERVARDEAGQPGVLLLVGAVGQERVDAQADAGLQGDAHRLVDAAELLDRDAEAGEVAVLAGAAVLLGAVRPNSPSLPICCTTSTGKWWSRSHCAACGAISASANSRTLRRNSRARGQLERHELMHSPIG